MNLRREAVLKVNIVGSRRRIHTSGIITTCRIGSYGRTWSACGTFNTTTNTAAGTTTTTIASIAVLGFRRAVFTCVSLCVTTTAC